MRRGKVTPTEWAAAFPSHLGAVSPGAEKGRSPRSRSWSNPLPAYLRPSHDRVLTGQYRSSAGRRHRERRAQGDRRGRPDDRRIPGRHPRLSTPHTGPRRARPARPGLARACGVAGAGRIGAADPEEAARAPGGHKTTLLATPRAGSRSILGQPKCTLQSSSISGKRSMRKRRRSVPMRRAAIPRQCPEARSRWGYPETRGAGQIRDDGRECRVRWGTGPTNDAAEQRNTPILLGHPRSPTSTPTAQKTRTTRPWRSPRRCSGPRPR